MSQHDLGKALRRPQSFVSKVESLERRLDVLEFVYWAQAIGADGAALVTQLAHDVEVLTLSGNKQRARVRRRVD
jgi:hypothetical protein